MPTVAGDAKLAGALPGPEKKRAGLIMPGPGVSRLRFRPAVGSGVTLFLTDIRKLR